MSVTMDNVFIQSMDINDTHQITGEQIVKLRMKLTKSPEIDDHVALHMLSEFSVLSERKLHKRAGFIATGVFIIAPGLDDKQRHYAEFINTANMLYGFMRGVVYCATASCMGGPFLVPSVNMAKEWERQKRDFDGLDNSGRMSRDD